MDNFDKRFCWLCLGTANDENFEAIEKDIKAMLDILPKLAFNNKSKQVTCSACSVKLQAAWEFKSTCIHTDKTIISYIDSAKTFPIDLKNIYVKERGAKQLINIEEDHTVCRLCLQLVHSECRSINEVGVDLMQNYIPEVNFSVTKDSVCKSCFDSLLIHSRFIKSCLDLDEKRKQICMNRGISAQLRAPSIDVPIKIEDIQVKSDVDEEGKHEFLIKTEEIEIKSEEIDIKSEESKHDRLESTQNLGLNNACAVKRNCQLSVNTDPEICILTREYLKGEWYKCDLCYYKTNLENNLKTHMLIHKDSPEIQWYKCDICNYKTKYKSSLKTHMMIHKDASEIQWHRCDLCEYKSMQKGSLKIHMLAHKDPSEIQWFKCDLCHYKSKRKCNLNKHMSAHEPPQIQWHECNLCDNKFKTKREVRKHLLTHKEFLERQWHECDFCQYKSKKKSSMMKHSLTHKDPSEIQWYECDLCDYKSKYKHNLNAHMLMHKDSLQVRWYECDLCRYKTRLKCNLKTHMVAHKDPSQIQWHKCNLCDHKSKQKCDLKRHMLTHKSPSEKQWHKCDVCDFKSKQNCSLKMHMLKHKSSL